MKSRLKKVISVLLTAIVVAIPLLSIAVSASGQTVSFGSNAISAKKGDVITVPIVISSNSAIELGGVSFYLQYNSGCLSYIEGGAVACNDKMTDALVYNNSVSSRLSFAWTSGQILNLPKSTVLFKPQFRVLDTATLNSDISLTVSEAYTFSGTGGNLQITELNVLNNTVNISISINLADGHVENVINLINAIGTVSYTDDCLQKILSAASAYSVLTDSQKKLVTNYSVLSQAMVEYERLRLEAEESAVSNEISQYMSKHLNTLSLTADTVKISDEAAVEKALEDFGNLSKNAQYKIFSYNTTLKNLKKKIESLKKEAEDRAAEAEEEARLRREAQEYAESFRQEKAPMLSLKIENLMAEHYAGLNDALETLNMLIGINPYVEEYLKSEKIILTGLMNAVQEIIKNSNNSEVSSEQLEADSFRNNFSYVLSLTPDTVTSDDVIDIRLAAAMFEMMSPSAQELLENEYSVISSLLEKIDSMSFADEDTDGNSDDSDNSNNNVVAVTKGTGKVTMRFASREMGAVIWILLLLFVLSGIIFASLQILYNRYYKARINKTRKLEETLNESN